MSDDETAADPTSLATAAEHLTKAAYFAELACESLSPVTGQAERWRRLRGLVFTLRDERDALRTQCDAE